MSEKDRERWDARWQDQCDDSYKPHPLLTKYRHLLNGNGEALDLACGVGQNAIWLAKLGYRVLGVDISPVALAAARSRAQGLALENSLRFEEVDLDTWKLPHEQFDLVCVIRFLDRRLFSQIRASLRPGGLLFYATRHLGILGTSPEANRTYLLRSGELLDRFAGWTILHYQEGPTEAELITRKPARGSGPHPQDGSRSSQGSRD